MPSFSYRKDKGNTFTIVVFDVPETKKRERNWLRAALKNLDFKMIQKSVWLGRVKIPKEFLEHIHKTGLINCAEIFGISKTGSLERLI